MMTAFKPELMTEAEKQSKFGQEVNLILILIFIIGIIVIISIIIIMSSSIWKQRSSQSLDRRFNLIGKG